jgi:Na+/alanine symporter
LRTLFGSGEGTTSGTEVLIERIFKNPKTTILGLLIIALCFVLVWGGRATLTEVSTFMVGAFALMFLKDPKEDGKATGGKPKDK